MPKELPAGMAILASFQRLAQIYIIAENETERGRLYWVGRREWSEMLIPVYIVGFILGGLVLFAIAQRVNNRSAKISLKIIGSLAGPVFFLAMILFSGWER